MTHLDRERHAFDALELSISAQVGGVDQLRQVVRSKPRGAPRQPGEDRAFEASDGIQQANEDHALGNHAALRPAAEQIAALEATRHARAQRRRRIAGGDGALARRVDRAKRLAPARLTLKHLER